LVGLFLIIVNWLTCTKLFVLCLYSCCVSITSVFLLSAFVIMSLIVTILNFIFDVNFQSSLFLLIMFLANVFLCLSQLRAYNNFVLLHPNCLLPLRHQGLIFWSIFYMHVVYIIFLIFTKSLRFHACKLYVRMILYSVVICVIAYCVCCLIT
jgi:hypothetical protein